MARSTIFCHSSVLQPNHCKGFTNQPKDMAKLFVDVVMARRAEITTARSICAVTKKPKSKPSRESQLIPHRVRPGDKSRCIKRVNKKSQRSIQQTRQTLLATGEIIQRAIVTISARARSCAPPAAAKTRTTSSRLDKTLSLGSSLCRRVCPGQYRPFPEAVFKDNTLKITGDQKAPRNLVNNVRR